MNTANLTARIRSLLDEREAGFWSDEEITAALNEAQTEVINYALFVFTNGGLASGLPCVLTPFETEERFTSVTGSEVPLPEDLLYIFEVKCATSQNGEEKPVPIWSMSLTRYAREHNSLLKSGAGSMFCHVAGSELVFSSPLNSGSYTIAYLRKPDEITEVQGSELPENCSGALVAYATALLLEKDKQHDESANFFRLYTMKVEQLAGL